jgi:hypothetical protein
VNLRFWLRQNFLGRGLRWLGERAQHRLFSGLRLPSLLPRSPLIKPDAQDPSVSGAVTDACVEEHGCQVRVLSSEDVRLKTTYQQWIAPLMVLPPGTTGAQLKIEVEKLPDYQPQGQYFFPVTAYLAALAGGENLAVGFAHRCRATRLPVAPHQVVEPAVLLVFAEPKSPMHPKRASAWIRRTRF